MPIFEKLKESLQEALEKLMNPVDTIKEGINKMQDTFENFKDTVKNKKKLFDAEKEVNMKYGDKVFTSTRDGFEQSDFKINGEKVSEKEFESQLKEAGAPFNKPDMSTIETDGFSFSRAQKDGVTMDNIETNGHSYEHLNLGPGKDTFSIDGQDVSPAEFQGSLNKNVSAGIEKGQTQSVENMMENQKAEMNRPEGSVADVTKTIPKEKEEEKGQEQGAGKAKDVANKFEPGKIDDISKQLASFTEKAKGVGADALATPAMNGPSMDAPGLSK